MMLRAAKLKGGDATHRARTAGASASTRYAPWIEVAERELLGEKTRVTFLGPRASGPSSRCTAAPRRARLLRLLRVRTRERGRGCADAGQWRGTRLAGQAGC